MKYLGIFSDLSFNLLICMIFAFFVMPHTGNIPDSVSPAAVDKSANQQEHFVKILLNKKGTSIAVISDDGAVQNVQGGLEQNKDNLNQARVLVTIEEYPGVISDLVNLQQNLARCGVKSLSFMRRKTGE